MRRIPRFEREFRGLHGVDAVEFRIDVVEERRPPSRLAAAIVLSGWIAFTGAVGALALAQFAAILLFLSVAFGL